MISHPDDTWHSHIIVTIVSYQRYYSLYHQTLPNTPTLPIYLIIKYTLFNRVNVPNLRTSRETDIVFPIFAPMFPTFAPVAPKARTKCSQPSH